MLSALKTRDYRLLWFGQTISLLGDQFHLIALPWLVLQLTGDPVQLGLVLAVAGIARGALMLPGGALADRHSPRMIMLGANVFRCVWTAGLAWFILSGQIEMWMVYLSALVLGTASGLFEPASSAAVPRIVGSDDLESGNSLVQMGDWFASFLGPAAAGTLIGMLTREAATGAQAAASLTGVGLALAFDALTFVASIITLFMMSALRPAERTEQTHPLHDIAEGLHFAWCRPTFRWVILIVAAANFLMTGPILVGVPVLAQDRLPEGAAALGIVLSAYAAGNLGGLVVAGSLKSPNPRFMGRLVIGLFALFAAGLSVFAVIERTWVAVPVMTIMGIGNGFLGVALITMVQRKTPERMLGRIMSLLMLAMFATMPASQAVAGLVVGVSFEAMYVGAGVGMLLLSLLAAGRPEVRSFGEVGMEPVERRNDKEPVPASA